jgi:hypothetical protein
LVAEFNFAERRKDILLELELRREVYLRSFVTRNSNVRALVLDKMATENPSYDKNGPMAQKVDAIVSKLNAKGEEA